MKIIWIVSLALVLAPVRAVADEFKIYPFLTGDRSDMAFYPVNESNSQWSSVDDIGVHDGDTTFVWSVETASFQGFRSRDTDIPSPLNGVIDTVRVLIVGRNHAGSCPLMAFVDTLGANTESVSQTAYFGVNFDSNWYAWTVCPWTSSIWTRQDLIDLEFGIRTGYPGLGDSAIVTQCNVTVVWTPGVFTNHRRRRLGAALPIETRKQVATIQDERIAHEACN